MHIESVNVFPSYYALFSFSLPLLLKLGVGSRLLFLLGFPLDDRVGN